MIRILILISLVVNISAYNEFKLIDKRIRPNMEYRKQLSEMSDNMSGALEREYLKFITTGIESATLKSLTASLTHSNGIRRTEVERLSIIDQSFLCTACKSAGHVLLSVMRESEGEENDPYLYEIAKDFCIRLKIQPPHVCDAIIDLNLPIFLYIARNSNVTAESACSTILQGSSCVTNEPEYDLKVNIDKNGPIIKDHKSHIPVSNETDIKILHLTDFHYDSEYLVGGLAECTEPLCCVKHEFENGTTSAGKQAGKWSDYRGCDVPWELYEASVDHILNNHKDIDYIYYTGDIIEHGVWKTSYDGIKKSLKDIYEDMKRSFGDIPVYPLIGNHESQPLNVFAPPDVDEQFGTQWLYDYLADLWQLWLPAETKATIKQGGYYTVSPRKGFRIIALNNNDAYTFNWWIMYKPSHLSVQLQWLHDTLLEAEKNQESVHILAHVPSGEGSTLNNWAREYRKIIERFYHIIGGVFNGHTHYDEINVFYTSGDKPKAINIAWNGGSLTPYTDLNPNYRTYDVETETYQVVNHDTYMFNLTEANQNPDKKPRWYKGYNFLELYGLKDLSPASLNALLEKFTKEPLLLYKYFEHKHKLGDPKLQDGCDVDCLMHHLCEAATTQFNDDTRCKQLQAQLKKTLAKL